MYLHAGNADGRPVQRPWAVVYAPLMLAAGSVLVVILALPMILPNAQQPSLRGRGSIGLGALATLSICAHLVLTGPPASSLAPYVPQPLTGWTAALAPLAALLLFRAATAPCLSSAELEADSGALQAHARRAAPARLAALLELLLAGSSLALLHGRLAMGSQWSWWLVAAPMISLQVVHVVLGCMTLGTLTRPRRPPPHAKDRVEWVRASEAVASEFGLCHCVCALLALPALCTLAAQLHASSDDAGAAEGASAKTWAAAYLPYAVLLSLPLCCCVCCVLLLPSDPHHNASSVVLPVATPTHVAREASDGESAVGQVSGYVTLPAGTHGQALPDGSRRRASAPAASSDSSDGNSVNNAPLLGEGNTTKDERSQVSPHLL